LKKQYTTSLHIIPTLIGILEKAGLSPGEIRDKTGIDLSAVRNPNARFPVEILIRLYQAAVEVTGDRALGLHIRDHLPLDQLHFVARITCYCQDLMEALQAWARYTTIITSLNRIAWRAEGDRVIISYAVVSPEHQHRFFPEFSLSTACRFARYFSGKNVNPEEALFHYPDPGYAEAYRNVFRCDVRFDQPESAIVIRRQELAEKIVFHDAYLKSILKDYAEMTLARMSTSEKFSQQLTEWMAANLHKGIVSAEMAASHLNMDRSTLHRRLKREKTTFKHLLETIRQQQAESLIRQDLNNTQIAYLLGFSEVSAFQHAFRRWFGRSPGSYRKNRVP